MALITHVSFRIKGQDYDTTGVLDNIREGCFLLKSAATQQKAPNREPTLCLLGAVIVPFCNIEGVVRTQEAEEKR